MPKNILNEIVEHKRIEIAQAKEQHNLDDIKRAALAAPKPRNFFAALTHQNNLRVIAEVKKASPSAGLIRQDFDPIKIAKAYYENGAAAISCLTDNKYFQGELKFLQQIKSAIPLPILRKDFIVDPYQVYESRAAGADCILLIAECLEDSQIIEYANLAGALTLTVLLEIHDEQNLERVKKLVDLNSDKRILLGINNRNLRTMKTTISHSLDLVNKIDNTDILVSESGIRTHDDTLKLKQSGINKVLVGEHLMKQDNPGAALRKLITG